MAEEDDPEPVRGMSFECWSLQNVVRDDSLTLEERDDALAELERLAEGGDAHARYLMGKLWRDGPQLTPDWVNARYWLRQAADQGHAGAQYALGKLCLSDDGEVQDTALGMEWLETAAQSGNHYAMYRLGKEYLKGKWVEKNTAKAVEWFTRSAERGNQYAQYMLGKLYLTGKEIPYDKEAAIRWLTASAGQGNEYAQLFLDRQNQLNPPSVMLSVTRLLHHMSRIFQSRSLPQSAPGGIQIDRKRRQVLQEKKIAHGQKPDDHEEEPTWNGMTKG